MNIPDIADNLGWLAAGFLAVAALASWAGTMVAYPILVRLQVLDMPSDRSSHFRPMIRGGGWAIGLAFMPLLLLIAGLTGTINTYIWLGGGFVLLFAVSAEDDVRAVTATGRIFAQLISVLAGLQALPEGNVFASLLGDWVPAWLEVIIVGTGWIWFINLFNFMDGIDGIAGTQTICLASAMLLLIALVLPGAHDLALLSVVLIGLALGFLVWNWHPAKIFMGDVGSVPLGFVLGFLLLAMARHGYIVAALIPALYYVTDTTVTLARRLHRGKKFWEAHREHFYQVAQAGLPRHDHIVLRMLAANICLIGCMLLSLEIGAWALLPAAAIVVVLCRHYARHGRAVKDATASAS